MANDSAFHIINAIPQLLLLDLLLSGDNAMVIALACRSLAPQRLRRAMLIGTGGAIILRLLMATIVGLLMTIPLLKLTGGALLVVIAIKLLLVEEEGSDARLDGGSSRSATDLWTAVGTIVIADVVMSLDNVVGLAAVAQGNVALLALGLLVSMPLLMFGSLYVTALLRRYPILVRAGGAMLGWIGGDIAISDPIITDWVNQQSPALNLVVPVLVAIYVLLQSRIIERRRPALSAAWRPRARRRLAVLTASLLATPATPLPKPVPKPVPLTAPPEAVDGVVEMARIAAPASPATTSSPALEPRRIGARRARLKTLLRSRWVPIGSVVVLAVIGVDLVTRISMPSPAKLQRYDCTSAGTSIYFRNGISSVKVVNGAAYANGTLLPDHQIEWGDYHSAAVALGIAPPTRIQADDEHAVVIDGGGFARVECLRHRAE
jgi:YjbE family integral membrane protein